MLGKLLLDRSASHVSSLTLGILFALLYMYDNNSWLDSILPVNGKPLALFTLIAITLVYEFNMYKFKAVVSQLDGISKEMKINRLMGAVNGMYGRFIESGEAWITNEYTLKELGELNDLRSELNVNSYTQGKLEFLTSKIKRA